MDGQDAGAVSDWRLGRQVHERLLHVTGTFTYTTVPPCICPDNLLTVRFQKLNIPVDVCMVGQDSGLLQQGSDITGPQRAQWAPVGHSTPW